MKNTFFTSLLCAIFCISCTNNDIKTSLQIENLKGKVKSVKESRYEAEVKFGEIHKGDYIRNFYDIPAFSYKVCEYHQWYWGGSVAELNFNKNGYVESAYLYDDDLDLENRVVYEWDGDYMLKMIKYDGNSIEAQYEQKFNGKRLIESKSSGTWLDESVTKYKTNSNGIIEEWIDYDDDGEIKRKCVNTISGNKIIESAYYSSPDVTQPYITTYTYEGSTLKETLSKDEMGKIIEEVIFDKDGRYLQRYNGDNEVTNYTYNSNGDIERFESKDTDYRFEYEYDKKGNWVKRISYKGIKPITIEEREIQYY